ncbi:MULTISPECIES: O-linked N-acetylglucosamine transferase [Actinosynnema]|uniref:O-linked N-acetylglucosamine transferase n=1 Tax=Actinosynnema TaxID=40566 RepID=UPI0020A394D6|nr:O-linked N-acetylglucosamine transferase [Actinosynnema pretiosum]MCP2097637.1 hypothetical protein [Actinosynnema pretiosum]
MTPIPGTPPAPDRVEDAVREVHSDVTRLLEKLGGAGGGADAYVAACLACLEAARSITEVATGRCDPEPGVHEALQAANAATRAIRFALVENGDARRAAAVEAWREAAS